MSIAAFWFCPPFSFSLERLRRQTNHAITAAPSTASGMTIPIAALAPVESPDEVALAAAADVELEDAEVVVLEVVVVLDVELEDELEDDDDDDDEEEEVSAATPMVVRALQIYQNTSNGW